MPARARGGEEAGEIGRMLLDRLRDAFGFSRAALLASPEGDLALLASSGVDAPDANPVAPGLDSVMERAWAAREPILVRRADPDADPRLSGLLPGAANVLVVP